MSDDTQNIATLHIGNWSSHCGACGGNCSPDDERHTRGGSNRNAWKHSDSALAEADGTPIENGCGALFVDKTGSGAGYLRPDLPWAGRTT